MTKKNDCLWNIFSFLIPAFVLSVILATEHFAPFGDKSLLIMDMSNQYVEFFNGLKSGDIYFSWSKSLGTNYIGVFAYYVSSPFSIITLLFPNGYMPYAILLLTILKIGCAGITSRLYFKERYCVEGIGSLIFSTAYSLMSYNLAYSMCIMWLDGVIWMPIILLGVERILGRQSGTLLCGSLFASLLSNYYISYMVILFSTIYFVVRSIERGIGKQAFFRCTIRYATNGVLAAGLGSIFLLPTFLSHFEGKLSSAQVDYSSNFNFEFPDLLTKLVFGGYDSITNSGAPFVFCGLLIVLLAFSCFARESIQLRTKLCHGAVLLLLALSMWLSSLDNIWHVFQYPNWFPYRYSFLFSFTVISTACCAFSSMKLRTSQWTVLALLTVTILGLSSNGLTIFRGLDEQFGYNSLSEYTQFQEEKAELLSLIPENDIFYRVRSMEDRSKNDAIGFSYSGITHYSSSYLASINNWVSNFGMAQSWFWCSDYGSTPVTDLFLNVGYIISDTLPGICYEAIGENSMSTLYQFSYDGSIGYFISAAENALNYSSDPFDNQNNLFCYLTGLQEPVFCRLNYSAFSEAGETSIQIISNGNPLYCYFDRQNTSAALYVNNEFISYLFTDETDCIQYLGTFPMGKTVTVIIETDIVSGSLYYLDPDVFRVGAETLYAERLDHVTVGNAGRVTGSISCTREGYLVTSIPASEGWRVSVDDTYVGYATFYDTFIMIPLEPGEHTVSITYIPPGALIGLAISVVSVVVLIILGVFGHMKRLVIPMNR